MKYIKEMGLLVFLLTFITSVSVWANCTGCGEEGRAGKDREHCRRGWPPGGHRVQRITRIAGPPNPPRRNPPLLGWEYCGAYFFTSVARQSVPPVGLAAISQGVQTGRLRGWFGKAAGTSGAECAEV